jgi:hypothetical protein
MNLIKEFWKQNKKEYLISLVSAILGGYLIVSILNNGVNGNAVWFIPVFCTIFLSLASFLLWLFLGGAKKDE